VLCVDHIVSIPVRARGSQIDSPMMVLAAIELAGRTHHVFDLVYQ
jgi:hypothetical protein